MAVVQVHPQAYTPEQKQREKDAVGAFVRAGLVHRLLWQEESSMSNSLTQRLPENLSPDAEPIILEQLLGLKCALAHPAARAAGR